MNGDTLLLRQVHPNWIREDRVTSQLFTPTPKDKKKLSVYDGDQVTAEAAWNHFTNVQRYLSVGVMAVTADECLTQGANAAPDPEPFPEHVLIDFSALSPSKTKSVAKKLARFACERGWQYRSGP